ncbi:hypothetical protein HFP70_35470 [Streptomyces sp. ARC14]|uniref:hypothetical protein n=1 Tax=Streptomyces sp. ARC14 TaxID=2724152 RepID=UPI003857DD99
MPSMTAAPALPECVTLMICAACGTHPFTAAPDHTFRCPCGSWITSRDIDLDGDETWAVTRAGELAFLPGPAAAWERYTGARTVMENPGVWGPELEDAHRAFLEALAELEAAQLLGVKLPPDADVQIGRVYLACVLNPDGTLSGSNGEALGWPCEPCAPYSYDPARQERHPCRNPRAHVWSQVRDWERNRNPTGREFVVRSPIAPDLPTARRMAAEKCVQRAAALSA